MLSSATLFAHSGQALAQLYAGGPAPLVQAGDGWWLAFSGVPDPAHNWMAVADPAIAHRIPGLIAIARSAGVPAMLAVTQAVHVAGGEALQRAAVDLAIATPHLAADLETIVLTAPAVASIVGPVEGSTEIASVTTLLGEAFGVDPRHTQAAVASSLDGKSGSRVTAAYLDGRLVSAAIITTVGDTAYVALAGTAPDVQRQGHGRAVLIEALRREREAGARAVHLASSSLGQRLYRRVGLTELPGLGPYLVHKIIP